MGPGVEAALSFALLVASVFFVAAEYSLVSCRRGKLESLAKKGNRSAKLVLQSLDELPAHIAGIQLGITMVGIGMGSVAEPFITQFFSNLLGASAPRTLSFILSFLLVTYVVVVIGEILPKYIALAKAERFALLVIRPTRFFVAALRPLIWLVEKSGTLLLKPMGIAVAGKSESLPKEELMMLLRSGGAEGVDEAYVGMLERALKLDALTADDIMVHRIDINWLDITTTKEQLFSKLSEIPHTRVPVCRGDIDDVAGILYVLDVVRAWETAEFDLEGLLRPAIAIPENLSMDRILTRMRESKSQLLIVMDEYGGTSGLVTLEDVVEEVFGELEDTMEGERPSIEILPSGRVSARAEVRFDELVEKLGVDTIDEPTTDTLANVLMEGLGRVPRPGDSLQTELGLLMVENMARRRITRVSLYPKMPES